MLSILLILALLVTLLNKSSSFFVQHALRQPNTKLAARSLSMKGRKVPINLRGEYMKQQRFMEQQEAMKRNRPKDVPVFKSKLFLL
jgi:hypothetical protein